MLQSSNIALGKALGDQGSNALDNERHVQYNADEDNKNQKLFLNNRRQAELKAFNDPAWKAKQEQYKAARKAYYDSPEQVATRYARYHDEDAVEYRQSEEYKAACKAYYDSPERVAYRQSEEYKVARQAARVVAKAELLEPVSYTHLTLPTIYSV